MNHKILVIDHDTYFIDAVTDLLSDEGYEVYQNGSFIEAHSSIITYGSSIDVIILPMGSNTSYKMEIEAINQADPDISIIGVISESSSHTITEALRLGVSDFIIKPILDTSFFLKIIEKSLELKTLKEKNKDYVDEINSMNIKLKKNLEVIKKDLTVGRELQRKMLPENGKCWHNVRFNYKAYASHYLSGDFIDYKPISDSQCLFYLLDVSGHGAASSFVALLAHNVVSNYRKKIMEKNEKMDPSELVAEINSVIVGANITQHLVGVFGVIDLDRNKITYCNAGSYPQPIYVSPDKIEYKEENSITVGLFDKAMYMNHELDMKPNSRFVMVTDGIFDIMDEKSCKEKEDELLSLIKMYPNLDDIEGIYIEKEVELLDDITVLQIEIIDKS